jgi:hypothetical protein
VAEALEIQGIFFKLHLKSWSRAHTGEARKTISLLLLPFPVFSTVDASTPGFAGVALPALKAGDRGGTSI